MKYCHQGVSHAVTLLENAVDVLTRAQDPKNGHEKCLQEPTIVG